MCDLTATTDVAQYKSVFKPGVARHLIKMGNPVYDIKPKKENPEATIFVFEVTEKFKTDFATLTEK